MMLQEVITVMITCLVTAGLSSVVTVKALEVHIKYLREHVQHMQSELVNLREQVDGDFRRFDDHLRAQYMQICTLAGSQQRTDPVKLSRSE